MLDKILINHLDKQDKISEEIDGMIEKVFNSIDIDEVIANPQGSMLEIADIVSDYIENNIMEKSIKNGKDLVAKIEALKKGDKIEIPDSSDPKLNEDLINV